MTDTEEQQAKEFLQRVQIKTMKKDLKVLREGDALKEKEKIANIKTPEEITAQQDSQIVPSLPIENRPTQSVTESVIAKSANEQRVTESSLKTYATEEEKQRIFSLEEERINLEKQLVASNNKDASIDQLQKSKFLSAKDSLQKRLTQIIESQKKLEGEQKFVIDQAQKATTDEQKNNFEKAGLDFDQQIKNLEKQRWPIEREIKDLEDKIINIDESFKKLSLESNNSRQRVAAIDSMLKDIYSGIIARVQKEKGEKLETQISSQEAKKMAMIEKIHKEQQAVKELNLFKNKEILNKIPSPYKETLDKSAISEEVARQKFMQDVEEGAKKEEVKPQQQNNNI